MSADDDAVLWSVADPGPGVAPEELSSLFERYLMVEPSAQPSGAGLGLPIARAIALAHGGTIDVESRPGTGSTFTLRVPVDGPEEPEP